MNIFHALADMIVYVSEAAARIFTLSDNISPVIGVQPFEGIPASSSEWED
ncbi:hypothetical protein M595_2943 [Lyngbya aestuarii BL J]|uniref:Uncharacterized protein n=1 Tax=Lyngbya aestuarii BL J TaxID=1348334 RepID=U7QIJ5_9CYAN|nr:hypothetical protein [Lyngbya aestuarii]ERT07097.1 hypothetical protein M595_2943 [Lyngbya aestuarii BL J]